MVVHLEHLNLEACPLVPLKFVPTLACCPLQLLLNVQHVNAPSMLSPCLQLQ